METDPTRKLEVRQIPEYGVTVDGVWIPWSFLEELVEQDAYRSQLYEALLSPSRDVTRVLESHQLLEKETRGGVHRGPALQEWMDGVDLNRPPLSNTSSSTPVPGPPEADSRSYRKFNVLGWMDVHLEPKIEIRCWVCGTAERFGTDGLAPGLEDLTAWAQAHVCPRNQAVA